jgi:hypothetical protein
MTRPDLQRALIRAMDDERRHRARLGQLEAIAAELRSSRSTLTDKHADEMAEVRTALNLATREIARIQERLR